MFSVHNKQFLEHDNLFCLLVKHSKNINNHTTKLRNEEKITNKGQKKNSVNKVTGQT